MKTVRNGVSFQRVVQGASLLLFLGLLWQAGFGAAGLLATVLPVDTYLRLDPSILLGTAIPAWTIPGRLWPALLFVLAGLAVGRVFCGLLCPMGATVDLADRLVRGRRDAGTGTPGLLRLKYHLLWALVVAGLLGVSLVFWVSPLSLITRFYALLLRPLLLVLGERLFPLIQPLAGKLGLMDVYFYHFSPPRYGTQLFLVVFFGALFALALMAPRFWCRYLCPAGAVFALFSRWPLIRRRVSDACTDCGRCRRHCPMGAIPADARQTLHAECIVCETCVRVCPVGAVRFAPALPWRRAASVAPATKRKASRAHDTAAARPLPSQPDRRRFLLSGLSGAGLGLLSLSGLESPHQPVPAGVTYDTNASGWLTPEYHMRPPGALPENDFLARCVRCGECMKACPTNTLQPLTLEQGISGLFSPVTMPRRGGCEPNCTACGQVCPTGAIRPLSVSEKQHAKIGTAVVLRHKCLAWEQERKCLVCDETCPYDAIEFRHVPGNPVAVPFVLEQRCIGCGYCEYHCPVLAHRAIVIEPMGALRLSHGSYRQAARTQGLDINLRRAHAPSGPAAPTPGPASPPTDMPPGFSQPPPRPMPTPDKLPPGFSEPSASSSAPASEPVFPPGFSEPAKGGRPEGAGP